jgi:hypothetical protein
MSFQDQKQFRSAMWAAARLLKHGRTDGASITTLFFAAGEVPPPEIYSEQDALFELPMAEITRLTQKLGGSNPRRPN